ncbi:MAG TPA: NAD(P)H-dependent glycerol-3-phosphate dehydrogenase [Gammaproteobacteria bacterium]|jgi:glycerol-3-phosphate dehydrogenase (NAD(P)+)
MAGINPTSSQPVSFAVLGAGSWGTALAQLLADNGHPTVLWGRDRRQIEQMSQSRINDRFLPGTALPEALQLTFSLETALERADIPLVVVPSSAFRDLLERIAALKPGLRQIAWATKGLEETHFQLLHQVAAGILGNDARMAVISGPNFAGEVVRRLPTATTVASNDDGFAGLLVSCLHNGWFRPYSSSDMVGVQLGGALKNALAIASGISDGLGFGANARAALLTRGLAEIMRLAIHMGAQPETLTGLAGIGDLILTCTDDQSRNRRLGLLLASGKSLPEAQASIGQVVEGVKTAQAAYRLAAKQQVEMPIIEQVYRMLYEGVSPSEAVRALLTRETKSEI